MKDMVTVVFSTWYKVNQSHRLCVDLKSSKSWVENVAVSQRWGHCWEPLIHQGEGIPLWLCSAPQCSATIAVP